MIYSIEGLRKELWVRIKQRPLLRWICRFFLKHFFGELLFALKEQFYLKRHWITRAESSRKVLIESISIYFCLVLTVPNFWYLLFAIRCSNLMKFLMKKNDWKSIEHSIYNHRNYVCFGFCLFSFAISFFI